MDIGIIGCGKMGSSMARLLSKDHRLYLYDRNPEKAAKLAKDVKGSDPKSPQEVVQKSELIILAIKPHNLEEITDSIKSHLNGQKILFSILTGITIKKLKENFKAAQIIRAVPNIAVAHGKGIIAMSYEGDHQQEIKNKLEPIFAPLGTLKWLPEHLLNSVTALTSSGIAFAAVIIESMIDAGIAMGFNAEMAHQLVMDTFSGTLALLKEKSPSEIKLEVSSPGGTTIAGLRAMEKAGVRSGIIETILAANDKAKNMDRQDK